MTLDNGLMGSLKFSADQRSQAHRVLHRLGLGRTFLLRSDVEPVRGRVRQPDGVAERDSMAR
jgi:hypothetical protein